MKSTRRGSDSPVHRPENTPRFQIQLDKWPLSPGEVERDWLYYGAGDALRGEKEKGEILAKLESIEREVARLAGMVERLLAK